MTTDPQVLQRRLARYVEPFPAKVLAQRVGCDVRTAENIRRGHWPTARHWLGLVRAFGADLTESVFHPERATARLEKELRDLEEQLARKQKALRDAISLAPRMARPAAPNENRSAVMVAPDDSGAPP